MFEIRYEYGLPKPGITPLMRAAQTGHIYELKKLIDAGGNVNAADSSGWSVLMYAVSGLYQEPVHMLLKAGADLNQRSLRGETALMEVAANGYWDDNLIEAGANVNTQNRDRQTALMLLAGADRAAGASDLAPAIQDALDAGADASLKDRVGRIAFDYLRLASCGKVPDWDLAMDTTGVSGNHKCDENHSSAFDNDDLRAAARLLEDAVGGKK